MLSSEPCFCEILRFPLIRPLKKLQPWLWSCNATLGSLRFSSPFPWWISSIACLQPKVPAAVCSPILLVGISHWREVPTSLSIFLASLSVEYWQAASLHGEGQICLINSAPLILNKGCYVTLQFWGLPEHTPSIMPQQAAGEWRLFKICLSCCVLAVSQAFWLCRRMLDMISWNWAIVG